MWRESDDASSDSLNEDADDIAKKYGVDNQFIPGQRETRDELPQFDWDQFGQVEETKAKNALIQRQIEDKQKEVERYESVINLNRPP